MSKCDSCSLRKNAENNQADKNRKNAENSLECMVWRINTDNVNGCRYYEKVTE